LRAVKVKVTGQNGFLRSEPVRLGAHKISNFSPRRASAHLAKAPDRVDFVLRVFKLEGVIK